MVNHLLTFSKKLFIFIAQPTKQFIIKNTCPTFSGWPFVGNEGMKPYMVMTGIHSLIPVLEHGQKERNYHFSTQSVSFRECMFLNWVLEFPSPSIHIEISVEHPVINAKWPANQPHDIHDWLPELAHYEPENWLCHQRAKYLYNLRTNWLH